MRVTQFILFATAGVGAAVLRLTTATLATFRSASSSSRRDDVARPPCQHGGYTIAPRTASSSSLIVVGDCAEDRTLVLAFHGNAEVARWLVPWASTVSRETDACVVLPEYRGYDGLGGIPTYGGSALDARAALQYVTDTLGVKPANLVYFGHSLGSRIAAELADVQTPRSLVLQAPFSSAREMGNRMYLPGLGAFWGLVSRVHFDTIRRVQLHVSAGVGRARR